MSECCVQWGSAAELGGLVHVLLVLLCCLLVHGWGAYWSALPGCGCSYVYGAARASALSAAASLTVVQLWLRARCLCRGLLASRVRPLLNWLVGLIVPAISLQASVEHSETGLFCTVAARANKLVRQTAIPMHLQRSQFSVQAPDCQQHYGAGLGQGSSQGWECAVANAALSGFRQCHECAATKAAAVLQQPAAFSLRAVRLCRGCKG